MTPKASDLLKEHFDEMNRIIPEIYKEHEPKQETREDKLFAIMKRSLGIIEAVYFQNRDHFTLARMEEYGKLVAELNELGFDYSANPEILDKATSAAIMSAKLPMEKAGKKAAKEKKTRKAM